MNTIGVIIPCYNNSSTLERAINSILAQTHPVDEIIVVNDDSQESAAIDKIMLNYPNIIYIKNDINIGVSASRNKAAFVSTSDIISFLDADDFIHPQKIELQLKIFRRNIAVACDTKKLKSFSKFSKFNLYKKEFQIKEYTNSQSIIYRNTIAGASILISKELFHQIGGYDENLRSCEDYDLWLRLLNFGTIVRNIKLPLYFYINNKDSLSHDMFYICKAEIIVLQKCFKQKAGELHKPSILFFWLTKHIIRESKIPNNDLKDLIQKNIKLLSAHPIMARILSLTLRFRLFGWIKLIRLKH